ncbi:hypothetical protein ACVBEG_27150 [Pseudomonas sp. GG8]
MAQVRNTPWILQRGSIDELPDHYPSMRVRRHLREHAWTVITLFAQTLETDHSELLSEVLRDYWRRFCYAHERSENR